MYTYNAYNLGIYSALPLPELEPSAEVAADLLIVLGRVDWSPRFDSSFEDEPLCEFEDDVAYFYWRELGKFSVSNGCRIIIEPAEGVEERLLRLPLLGTVLAVLLHQRGHLVLHASAVSIDNRAALFMGQKGQGKSTTAATLFGRGHKMIADDIVALSMDQMGPRAVPGYPQFKLYPEAAICSFGDSSTRTTQLATGYEKCGHRLTERFVSKAVSLKRIYVLRTGTKTKITRLGTHEALLALISNSYVARFGKQLLSGEQASLHLQQCAHVIRDVNVYSLEQPHSLDNLHETAELIEDHVRLPLSRDYPESSRLPKGSTTYDESRETKFKQTRLQLSAVDGPW